MSREASYLLDSHALLWWWFDPDRLSTAVRELLEDPATPVLVSAASVWELSLKHLQGKLHELSGTSTTFSWEIDASPHFHARSITTDHGWKITIDRGLDVFQWFEFSLFNAAKA
jgi:hypothetical protein